MKQDKLVNMPLAVIYWLPVIVLCGLLVYDTHFAPNEDAASLYELQTGMFMGGDFLSSFSTASGIGGRFAPSGSIFHSLVMLFASAPTHYYVFNAIELVLFSYMFLHILEKFVPGWWANRVAISLLFLITPGAVISFFELPRIEDTTLLLFSFFIVSYICFLDSRRMLFLVSTILFANIAIYNKEPVFAAMFAFATLHLMLTWRKAGPKEKLLDMALITSALAYVLQYFFIIRPHVSSVYGENVVDQPLYASVKNIANYALFSDPVLFLAVFPLALWRGYQILHRRAPAHPMLDSMLFASIGYLGVFMALNMYSPYYLLPSYFLALPPLFFFIRRNAVNSWPSKICLVSVCLVLVGNTIPFIIHKLSYSKYLPANFNSTIAFLAGDIERRYQGRRLNIYLDGVDRGGGRGMYWIFGEYLKFSGLSIRKFDFKSDLEALDPTPLTGYLGASPFDKEEDINAVDPDRKYRFRETPFSVFQPGPLPSIKKGDYLIVSPHSVKNLDATYFEALSRNYDLVFKTDSRYAIPNLSLKVFIKKLLIEYNGEDIVRSGTFRSGNIFNAPDYYVWVRK